MSQTNQGMNNTGEHSLRPLALVLVLASALALALP
jgi:hypothetical protein